MNENEIDRIAAATSALRPDWPLPSIRTLLHRPEIATRARRDVAVALAWVACESESKTPARVLEAGPWWTATNAGDATHRPPRKSEECELHPGEYATSCRGCASDRLTGETTTPHEPRRPDRSSNVAALRAELAAAKQHHCTHGINRDTATCNECARSEKESDDA